MQLVSMGGGWGAAALMIGGLGALLGSHSPAKREPARPAGQIEITWLGHAAFWIVSPGGTRLLIDPWLKGNPATPDSLQDVSRYHPDFVLVSHSHSDHSADAKAIALASGAPVVGTYDFVGSLGLPDKQILSGNVGGTLQAGDVVIHIVPAMHGSAPDGRPIGFVLQFTGGRTLYDTGDTWIFGDMALIQELYHPSIVLLNVGGGPYTEDPHTAALAIKKYFQPEVIVPMHYGTFPALAQESDVRAAFAGDHRLRVLKVGQRTTL
ncbi:MAG TPA: metal-dependent hydrolase [Gemmatimonadales bacterium]|nr:metal-dependent hydrolase [Gemmatimonadales bacterium]